LLLSPLTVAGSIPSSTVRSTPATHQNPIAENPNVTQNGGHPFTSTHADGDVFRALSDYLLKEEATYPLESVLDYVSAAGCAACGAVLLGSADRPGRSWQVLTMGEKQTITAVAFRPDGRHLASRLCKPRCPRVRCRSFASPNGSSELARLR
jgi:hypothetical protein